MDIFQIKTFTSKYPGCISFNCNNGKLLIAHRYDGENIKVTARDCEYCSVKRCIDCETPLEEYSEFENICNSCATHYYII